MGPTHNSAALFIFSTLVLFLLALGAVWVTLDLTPEEAKSKAEGFLEPRLESERSVAAALSIPFRAWMTARVGVVLLAIVIGVWIIRLPLLTLMLVAAALFGFPWFMSSRAEGKRLKMERAFLDAMRQLSRSMSSNIPFVQSMRNLGENPSSDLALIFQPLRGDTPILLALEEVSNRALSPLVNQILAAMISTYTRNPGGMRQMLETVLLDATASSLEIEEQNSVIQTRKRTIIRMMMGVLIGVFLWLNGVANFHDFYAIPVGQATLVVVVVLFGALVWVTDKLMRGVSWPRWDMREARKVLGGGFRG